MNDAMAERIAIALEQLALEMAERHEATRLNNDNPPYGANVTIPGDPTFRAAVTPQVFLPIGGGRPAAPWVCPVHGTNRTVPAGISQRTGKAYDSFVACPERGCNEKPPRFAQPAPQRAMPPSEGVQARDLP